MIDIISKKFYVDFFSIEDGSLYGYDENVVHISGCLWRDYEETHLTEYTFLVVPVSEFVKDYLNKGGCDYVFELMSEVQQYESDDITPIQAVNICDNYFSGESMERLCYSEIDTDTPMGNYYFLYQ